MNDLNTTEVKTGQDKNEALKKEEAENKELTLEELDKVSGAGAQINHNQTCTSAG
jgi:hypothetical protein